MEKKLFIAYQSFEIVEKIRDRQEANNRIKILKDEERYWMAIPIGPDWCETVVGILETIGNADALVVFFSDSYWRLDKRKCLKSIADRHRYGQDAVEVNPVELIDGSLEDKDTMFLVSVDSIKFVDIFWPIYAIKGYPIERFHLMGRNGAPLFCNEDAKEEYYTAGKVMRELFSLLWDGDDNSFDEVASFLFSVLMLPMIISVLSNRIYNTDYHIPCSWTDYCKKYAVDLWCHKLEHIAKHILTANSEQDSYIQSRERLYGFFDIPNKDVFSGRMIGLDSDTPCPCGSGKIWQYCHGKHYSKLDDIRKTE